MPVAPAESEQQAVTYTDNRLKDLQRNVAGNLQHAGVATTYEAVKPVHVPDEPAENVVDHAKIAMENNIPGSFKSTPETALSPLKALSEHLDYADQLVTGRTHVVGEAQSFTAHRDEKENKKIEFNNAPKQDTRSAVKKLVDWLHD